MLKIIKAVVQTNSADDQMGRVKLKSEGIWNQDTELVQSVNGCPLSKGEVVFVSVEDGYYNPLILGKADRNEIVLNLLIDRINMLEDKMNEMVKMQNNILNQLSTNAELAMIEGVPCWAGTTIFAAMGTLKAIPNKTKLKDIQDNYK